MSQDYSIHELLYRRQVTRQVTISTGAKMQSAVRCVLLIATIACGLAAARPATKFLLTDEKVGVCLDGSPPGYYMRPGQEEGSNRWIVHLMGGGWCMNQEECFNRSYTRLGSTKPYPETEDFGGFLSDDVHVNADFHSWNMVYVIYCDGGSFSGDRAEPEMVNGRALYYRGYQILQAIIADLKVKGMANATDVILTGCSAGGLSVYLHADYVHSTLSPSIKFKALPDAGYFLDIPDVQGYPIFEDGIKNLMKMQNVDTALIPKCKAQHTDIDMWKCMFAPYIYDYIKTPIFVLNSMYDTAQLSGIYRLPCLPNNCSAENMNLFEHFNDVFVEKLQPVLSSFNGGYFIDACLVHCQTLNDEFWTKYSAKGHPLWESFGDWYYERPSSEGATRVMDCKFPCNPTCPVKN